MPVQVAAVRTSVWAAGPTGSLIPAMAGRNAYDPLEPTADPRWHVVRDRLGRVVESKALPAGTDLKGTMVTAIL